ncbi:hypothetical protein [Geobacter argillaceus]|uniref:Uncharacterized protein n=1 Tax=Geobacter argillaceus TaxID=345631 RepID=A0A562WQW2_9BACT|nr:hypothetical protein [Geobacter argillaceus]TWJ32545.1 hypothetical protein JN12_00987 [Geobacter argillaceus]
MTEGMKFGVIFVAMSIVTIAFCLLFYPPITEKLKDAIALKEQRNYEKAKIYAAFTEAIRDIVAANIMTGLWYVIYFFISTQYLLSKFGAFSYGDNEETFTYLIWVGIPYVACYLHFVLKAGKHQLAIKKSNLQNQENNSKVFWYTFFTPMVLFIVVQKIFHFSTNYPDKNVFLLLSGMK